MIPQQEPDTGADGCAMLARPHETHPVHGRRVSSVKSEAVEVRRYLDVHRIDRMHNAGQLSDRQHGAAKRLLAIYHKAGQDGSTTGFLGYVPAEKPEEDWDCPHYATLPELLEGESYRDLYRRVLRLLPSKTQDVLVDMMGTPGRHPGAWLATAQIGLDQLATFWGMRREVHGEKSFCRP